MKLFLKIAILLACSYTLSVAEDGKAQTEEELEAYLGVYVSTIHPATAAQLDIDPDVGLVVERIDADSPADKAGIQEYDILLKFDDQILVGTKQIGVLVRSKNPEESVVVTLLRKGQSQEANIILGSRPKHQSKIWKWEGSHDFHLPLKSFGNVDGNIEYKFNPEELKKWSQRMEENIEKARERIHRLKPNTNNENQSASRIMMEIGNRAIKYEDLTSSLDYNKRGNSRTLTIRDKNGTPVYEGPLNEDGDFEKIPLEYRGKARLFRILESNSSGPQNI